jgi:hypothetical protein
MLTTASPYERAQGSRGKIQQINEKDGSRKEQRPAGVQPWPVHRLMKIEDLEVGWLFDPSIILCPASKGDAILRL